MNDRQFKQALDRWIEREDPRLLDDDGDEIETREIECARCSEKFDIPAASKRASYICDECAERDLYDGDELSDERE